MGEEETLQKDQQQQKMQREGEMDSLQTLPTKQDMAEMLSHLNATRRDIQNVLQRVEESEVHLDDHKKAIYGVAGEGRVGLVGNEEYPIQA